MALKIWAFSDQQVVRDGCFTRKVRKKKPGAEKVPAKKGRPAAKKVPAKKVPAKRGRPAKKVVPAQKKDTETEEETESEQEMEVEIEIISEEDKLELLQRFYVYTEVLHSILPDSQHWS